MTQHTENIEMGKMKRDPAKWAVLVIDMQKGFVDDDSPVCVAGAKATVPALAKTIEAARSRGMRIVWILRKHACDGSDMERFRKERLDACGKLDLFDPSNTGFELAEGLSVREDDEVVYKTRYSGFIRTELGELLQKMNIEGVLVCGTQTPNCVRATAIDAFEYDYETVVPADCTSSANPSVQQSNLMDMRNAGLAIVDRALDWIAEFFS